MKKGELVFFPSPGISHLVSTIELAKRLIDRDDRFSITILTMKAPFATTPSGYIESVATSSTRIRFIDLPPVDLPPPEIENGITFLSLFIESHKSHFKHTISKLISSESNSVPLAGLVVDMFSTTMVDIANELGIPSYIYFTSSAATLGLSLHLQTLHTQITTELKDYVGELLIPSFINSVPPFVLPSFLLNKKDDAYTWILYHCRKIREAKGIIVNTFTELETNAVNSFANGQIPPVYPVGPLLDLDGQTQGPDRAHRDNIMKWLDNQPSSSVIFLCFGSMGTFGVSQVKEIALGLERSGFRFLWSLRRPPTARFEPPSDYTNLEEILPDGFLERMDGRGLVCGWVPQVAVLAHQATGGFVSHCGWNSILESFWFGVPILSWPLYAEQKLNTFQLVKEFGLAVEMRPDCNDGGDLIMAEEVERGVRCVMDGDSEVRRRTKEMGKKSRKASMDGGSSSASLERFIKDCCGSQLSS